MRRLVVAVGWTFGLVMAAQAAILPLQRGVGVHEWLNWSPINADGSYVWPPYRSEKDWLSGSRPISDWPSSDEFARVRTLGFDFVRLSVDPGPLLASDGAKRQQALDVLSRHLQHILSAGLKVVFDLHGVSQVPAYSMKIIADGSDSPGVASYRHMVREVALMLSRAGTDKVAIEPYNEPAYYPCDGSGGKEWQRIMAATVRDIRAVSIELSIVVTGACGGNIKGLVNLDPSFDDPNIYYSFHMYDPHSFTHQRSEREGGFLSGLPWPADKGTAKAVTKTLSAKMEAAGLDSADRSTNLADAQPVIAGYFKDNWGQSQLDAGFDQAVTWARSHNIPNQRLLMGEFGVIALSADGRIGAEQADRIRYVTAVRQNAERRGIPWSVWEYSNPYGMSVILPKGPAVPDPELLKALGLLRL